jgi:hypothetical protein
MEAARQIEQRLLFGGAVSESRVAPAEIVDLGTYLY